jgi:hypothetical protein
MSFLGLIHKLPEFLGQFKGNIFAVVEFLIQLFLQFLIDSFIFLLVHPVRGCVDHKKCSEKPKTARSEYLGKGFEHLINYFPYRNKT